MLVPAEDIRHWHGSPKHPHYCKIKDDIVVTLNGDVYDNICAFDVDNNFIKVIVKDIKGNDVLDPKRKAGTPKWHRIKGKVVIYRRKEIA